jgi:N-methylhydantoinase A/oxoprolinase/acetone carboxylase beta subunit
MGTQVPPRSRGRYIETKYAQSLAQFSTHSTSRTVANLGFIERENAALLNASILPFPRSTIRSFEHAMTRLQLQCPLFIAQNNGTILPAWLAARLPIRTFSSGPTNSMCGAAFLVQDETDKENMLVVDIGM